MHDDDAGRWPPARRGSVTVDLDREAIAVTTPDGERAQVPIADHREDVVRRLLARGLSPRLLRTLVPEFRPIIDRVTGR